MRRIVYLSGLVPRLDPGEALSPHLASRLEVEHLLAEADCSTLSVRAGVVIGAGSTSYEVVRQLALAAPGAAGALVDAQLGAACRGQ